MIKRMCMALSVLIVAMTLTMPTSYAANWKWVYSSSKIGFYFDTETASKTNGGTVYAWVKAKKLDGSFYLVHEKIWNKGWTHSIGSFKSYDAHGNYINEVNYRYRRSFEVAPGTVGAQVNPVIWQWTMKNGQDM